MGVLITPYGEYRMTNDQVRSSCLHRAIKRYQDDTLKVHAYREKLLYRYASKFCFWRWKNS